MYVLFDIGGTKTRVAVSEDLVTFTEPKKFDTPASYTDGVEQITNAARELAGNAGIEHIAGGLRGRLMDDHSGSFRDSTLPDWQEKRLVDDLERTLGAPVIIENDAAMAGLGEAHFGAGKGYDIVAYHTVSTGVGGGRIDHGVIDASASGFEPGKQIVDIDHTLCGKCESPMLEDHISGTAMEVRFGKKAYEIPQEDPVWDELAYWLAHGLKNTILYWSPHVIVLGGSMILGDPRIRLEDIMRHTKAVLGEAATCPDIRDAAYRDEGALYGAMVRISQQKDAGGIMRTYS